ncbi:hypothetical protein SAMN04488570_3826 [Nocardioides scoriae]|uniref:ScyD/ScyE family protein n=1 Tax=Nocardioides scoriae TaxID=642780 RepID=A0A1H1YF48_9ACTN|nr:ScyD/ScyE family protein [Nocardioides scoriae]SDT20148.1 hypothetical protein SAMN04488570_3826 [Nocardioides scoriae]
MSLPASTRRPTRSARRLRLTAVLGTALATAAVTLAAPASTAAPTAAGRAARAGSADDAARTRVVASGLDNPRQLSFDRRGRLFVAESGVGGSGPCVAGAESDEVCYGASGAVTMLARGKQRRVVTGLPSLAAEGGNQATGPTDVAVGPRGGYRVSIGLGGDEDFRRQLPPPARRQLGTVMGGTLGGGRFVLADLVAHEQDTDPDGAGPDSNPGGLVRTGSGVLVSDAGGNDLLRARVGRVSTVATFPVTAGVPNPFGGPAIDAQAVPTSVTRGPGGSFFVSQLVGFPFPQGGAKVFRVVPGRAPTVWATGLTNVTDLTWHRGRLHAVQLADAGLLGTPEGELPSGSLVRVARGSSSPSTVASGLAAPYGVAVRGRAAYVTTCSVCADGGTVTRVPLG